ncbi:MAG: hypothetical protein HY587_06585 [Candidatus Omnitrophica bacterium]|nr:hypothetical protein [Candidatus Omnitrophota bacterium]
MALAQSDITVSVELDKSIITIGELLQCKFLVRHDSTLRITDLIGAKHLEEFKVKDSDVIVPFEENGQVVEGRMFKLTAYELGEHVIPAVEIRYLDQDQVQKSVFSTPAAVTVRSVDPQKLPGSDIRGLKGLKLLESALGQIILWVLAGAGIASAGLLVFIKLGKRTQVDPDRFLTPAERALKALGELEKNSFPADGQAKTYYAGVSTIVRRFLEEQFRFPALEYTTREINRFLNDKAFDSSVQKVLARILEECDTIKFTDFKPQQHAIRQLSKRAEEVVNLVQATMVAPQTEIEAKAS